MQTTLTTPTFEDLYTHEGLQSIHTRFHAFLKNHNTALYERLCDGENTSDLILALAPYVEDFIAELFGQQQALAKLHAENTSPYLDKNHKKTEKHTTLYGAPLKQDFDHLVDLNPHPRPRTGFSLTDEGITQETAHKEALYCLYCHDRDKDSCSKGLHQKNSSAFETNPLGNTLSGCPLGQKISEMNLALAQGYVLGALAIICIDNPLAALTGNRICNACSKACIFQKQTPVNIPSVESYILKTVLALPYGFEMYSLLTRWNPLNFKAPLPAAPSGKKVLVVGMGPAGLNLSHHLLHMGHMVTGIDGLKIEPFTLPNTLIVNVDVLMEDLETRTPLGFGGVAEYGITVRWNKNYLNVLHLIFARRPAFTLIDNVRFGGGLTAEDAFETYGFNHIALCLGAGKPKILSGQNALPKGVHTASDFLMALHLTQPHKRGSMANFVVRLPIVVVGGGLTSIDTATEALAYYPKQVAKFKALYVKLSDAQKQNLWNTQEKAIAEEFLSHAEALEKTTDPLALLQSWGGATLVTRKGLNETPAYRLNHEEITKALEEGIVIRNDMTPMDATTDDHGWVKSIFGLPAKTVFYALGTAPNTLAGDGDFDFALQDHPFMVDPRGISIFGDLHPKYQGSVVSAMASGKDGAPFIDAALAKTLAKKARASLKDDATATVLELNRLTPTIIEVVIHAPLAAKHFKPGQFYRLQNYEAHGKAFEPIALTGAEVNVQKGTLSLIALEMGASSCALKNLNVGEPVALMGPTGTPSHIPNNKKVLLVGGGLGNAVLFSIGKAMRDNGCTVTYIAGYKNKGDIFKAQNIEAAADRVIWCTEQNAAPHHIKGTIIDGLNGLDLQNFDHILTIGSAPMMAAVKKYITAKKACARLEASINAPMQCMMKEICGRCLQKHQDEAGNVSYVFSCTNQDQDMHLVDFESLQGRLNQNSVAEKLMNQPNLVTLSAVEGSRK